MERRARLRVLVALAVGIAAPALAATEAHAGAFMTRDEALALAFPGAIVEARNYAPPDTTRDAVRRRAKVREVPRLIRAHVAWRGETLAGVAFFDTRVVRTMPGTFMVVIAPDTTVRRVDVLSFHEPPDYRPMQRWLDRFGGERLDDRLWPRRDIRNLSGATLSARAVTEGVRLALASFELVVAPDAHARPREHARR